MALKKLCRCGKVIDVGQRYCVECSKRTEMDKRNINKHYDKNKRNKKNNTFYHSKEWLLIRDRIISKYNGLDLYSYYVDKEIKHATTVHHIQELEENWNRRLDIYNLIPLTDGNHKKIHKLYRENKAKTQELLYGLLRRWREENA